MIVLHYTSNCYLHIEYEIQVKLKHGYILKFEIFTYFLYLLYLYNLLLVIFYLLTTNCISYSMIATCEEKYFNPTDLFI